MVKQFTQFTILFSVLVSVSGCSKIKSIWNEPAPARQTVYVQGDPLPDFKSVFSDDDALATQTLAAYRDSMVSTFHEIKGAKPDFLEPGEIRTLIHLGFLKLDNDPEVSTKKALNLLELFGYKNGISLKNVTDIFDWVEVNRQTARRVYETFAPHDKKVQRSWSSADLTSMVSVFGALASRTGDEKIESAHMAELIEPWVPDAYPHVKAALKSGIDLVVAFFASACGDRVQADGWNGHRIGKCLVDFNAHFDSSTPVFDFVFGTYNPAMNREKLLAAAERFPESVESWLQGHQDPLFQTTTISDFSKALDVDPPYTFLKLTAWIPKLNADSTETGLSPTFFLDLSKMVRNWINTTVTAGSEETCTDQDWKNCVYKGDFAALDLLWSSEYATLIQHKTLGLVNRVALYESVSAFLIEKLDTNHTGVLSDSIKDLITIVVSLIDTEGYAQNVLDRILEKPISPSDTEDSIRSIRRQGLSELAAFGADLIPARDANPKGFLSKLESEIVSPNQTFAYTIDQLGITAVLYAYDLIGNLRDDYLAHYRIPVRDTGVSQFVKREDVMESLPVILHDHFPQIYTECVQWGFERTCGVIFSEILSSADLKTGEIETSDIDLITLTAILLESMMNRCDQNHDGVLSGKFLHGFDEKHCMVDASTALALRLMRSNIVAPNSTAETWIKLVKGVPLIRWAAQSAISKGTLHGIVWTALPPASWLSRPATLGSVMSLAAEFMSSDKTKAIETDENGPVKSPGDELLYHHELTQHYLFNPENSTR